MHGSFKDATEYYGISIPHAEKVWLFIEAQYTSPSRHYHNINHILEMVEFIHDHWNDAAEPHAVVLAAWYHDLIYDTTRKDNESQSAFYALMSLEWMLGPNAKTWIAYHVHSLVQGTIDHRARTPDECVLFDADLIRFASDKTAEYDRDIRKEYSWVPPDQYVVGRKEALQSFLNREFIFSLSSVRAEAELKARTNIERSIANVEG